MIQIKNVRDADLEGALSIPEETFMTKRGYTLIKIPKLVFDELIPLSHAYHLIRENDFIRYHTLTDREYWKSDTSLNILGGGQVNKVGTDLLWSVDFSKFGYIPGEIIDVIERDIFKEYNKCFGITKIDHIQRPKVLIKSELDRWKEYICP